MNARHSWLNQHSNMCAHVCVVGGTGVNRWVTQSLSVLFSRISYSTYNSMIRLAAGHQASGTLLCPPQSLGTLGSHVGAMDLGPQTHVRYSLSRLSRPKPSNYIFILSAIDQLWKDNVSWDMNRQVSFSNSENHNTLKGWLPFLKYYPSVPLTTL